MNVPKEGVLRLWKPFQNTEVRNPGQGSKLNCLSVWTAGNNFPSYEEADS